MIFENSPKLKPCSGFSSSVNVAKWQLAPREADTTGSVADFGQAPARQIRGAQVKYGETGPLNTGAGVDNAKKNLLPVADGHDPESSPSLRRRSGTREVSRKRRHRSSGSSREGSARRAEGRKRDSITAHNVNTVSLCPTIHLAVGAEGATTEKSSIGPSRERMRRKQKRKWSVASRSASSSSSSSRKKKGRKAKRKRDKVAPKEAHTSAVLLNKFQIDLV